MASLSEQVKTQPYAQAALAYAVYGVVYLGGALLELTPERMKTSFGFVPWWSWYVIGALMVASLPVFLWRKVRWLAFVLAAGTGTKFTWLVYSQGRHLANNEPTSLYNWMFAVVAACACGLLIRAALRRPVG